MMSQPLLTTTDCGLYCPAGDFWIDAWRPVARNIVTHAHSDHATRGCAQYLVPTEGFGPLRHRLCAVGQIDVLPYRQSLSINNVRVSLHPAGHVFGSAQVRVEMGDEVWVVSGDYKRMADPTCAAFEPVRCHTFITESTFGLPIFHWEKSDLMFGRINQWWQANASAGKHSVIFAYSLGKAQRVLASVDAGIGPLLAHGAVMGMVKVYAAQGVAMPPMEHASVEAARASRGALIVAPPGTAGSVWLRKFYPAVTAMASGWMTMRSFRKARGVDCGFAISDHVDWDGLLDTIDETGATRIGVTHGYTNAVTRYLAERGKDAFILPTRFGGEEESESDEEVPAELVQ